MTEDNRGYETNYDSLRKKYALRHNSPIDDVKNDENLPNMLRENKDLWKYYTKGHLLFSKYNEGIQLYKGIFTCFLIIDENFPHTYGYVIIIFYRELVFRDTRAIRKRDSV
jgi:hypothetical protein